MNANESTRYFRETTESSQFSTSGSNETFDISEKCRDTERPVRGKEFPNESIENEIILSIYWKRGKLGAAYYSTCDAEVHLLNDVTDIHPDFKNLKCLLNQVQYSSVITCGKLADSFVTSLAALVNDDNQDGTERRGEISTEKLILLPGSKKDLNYDSCRRLILGRRFNFEPRFASEEEHLLFVNTQVDFKCESMVTSFGMLLKYLDKHIPQINFNHEAPPINVIEQIHLERLVFVDEESYRALQIFNPIHHPSAFKRSNFGSNREGLSIFGIFSRCKSVIGTKKLRQIFMNPIKNVEELNARLDAIEFCTKPRHEHVIKNLSTCMKKMESVTGILACMYRSRSNINHWKSLYSSMYNAILIGRICESHSSQSQLFDKVAKSITERVHEVAHYINRVVDFEESSLRNQFTVKPGIDPKLDRMREKYAQVPDALIKVAELELKELPEYIEECSVVYITELGYLLSIPLWTGDGTNLADYKLSNFQVKFIVNRYVHYKTPRCAELDRILGDMLAGICEIESKVMVALMEFIHERVPDIVHVVNCVAELDCIIAMADIASENNYTRPFLTYERKLEIIKGRHPVQELCAESFVPNDTKFDGTNGDIQILTGPNASGKSVYLKQIGAIAFLAHVGSFVPAQRAVVGILDHIHCRIRSAESVSARISSFVLDLKQMSRALYSSTPSSLIIIDEFGKGTTEIDGLSLLAASLVHFAERKEKCPFVAVSTHFHNLARLLPETPAIDCMHMDYMIEDGEIVYLHRIEKGTCFSSLAHLAAKRAGLDDNSVQRFLQVLGRDGKPIKCNSNLNITKTMLREVKQATEFLSGKV